MITIPAAALVSIQFRLSRNHSTSAVRHTVSVVDSPLAERSRGKRTVTIDAIREHEYILTPGRYVGVEEKEEDGEPFEEKMQRLVEDLSEQFTKSEHLEEKIKENLKGIGLDI